MKYLTVALASALAALVVVACGGGEPTVSPGVTAEPGSAGQSSPTPAAPQAEPAPPGAITPPPTGAPVASTPVPAPTPTAASPQPPTVSRPTPVPTAVRRANSDPVLAPVEDHAVAVGSTLSLTLSATDADGDVVSFGASPLPLFANASLHARTGSFVFSPDAAQVGSFQLTFDVTDGMGGIDSEMVTITVEAPLAGGMTALLGRILDANDFVNGKETPIVGATVSLLDVGVSAVSDGQGRFVLQDTPGGSQIFDINATSADAAPDGSPYAGFREEIDIIAGARNVVDRPFFLPRIAVESLTPVDPGTTTVVTNESLGVKLTIPPNTAKGPDGSNFTGEISISLVPEALAPAALPENLKPGMLITLQPVGVTFATPARITFPNVDNLTPGSETDLWSLDPDAGTFVIVGTGRVSGDGTVIETISGGIRANDWHTPMPPGVLVQDPEGSSDRVCGCRRLERVTGSATAVHSGNLLLEHSLPSYVSLNNDRALKLVYNSTNADPQPIISTETTIFARAAVPQTVSASLRVAGLDQGVEIFTDTRGLDENLDEPLHQAVQFDASAYEPGAYPYRLRLTSNYPASSISSQLSGEVLVNNQQRSPLGAGWTLDGLQRLHFQDDRVMVTEGDGSALVFAVVPDVLLLDSFEGGASESWSDGTTAETPAFTEFLGRFGSQTVSLTLDNLPEHTGIELHFDFYTIDTWDGTDATYGGPDEFLVGHGTSVDNLFIEDFVYPGRGRPDQSYTTTEPEISGRLGFGGFPDAIYRDLNNGFTFPHRGASVTLNFTGMGLQALSDESWGIDNVSVELLGVPAVLPIFRSPPGALSTFAQHDDGTFTRTLRDGTRVRFNAQGLQTSWVDPNDNTTAYAYDAQGRLISITDPVGLVTRFTYASHLTSTTDSAGRTTRFEHDDQGNLIRITDPDGTTRQLTYDTRHRVISQTDRRGFTTRYEYNFAGRHVKSTMPDGSTRLISPSETVGLAELTGGQGTKANPLPVVRPEDVMATFTDGNGNTTTYRTNRFGSAAETTDPLGQRSMTPRDRDGLRGRSVSFNGTVTLATFEDGNLVMEREAVGTPSEREARYEYHPTFNKLTRVVDPEGNVTTLEYDARGNLIKVTNALGGEQTSTYDPRGLLLTSTDENGNVTRWTYDANGNLETITDALGNASRFTRNAAGIVTGVTQAGGSAQERSINYAYDTVNRLVERADGTGAVSRHQYDADGNRTEIETSAGQTIGRFYDEMGRLKRILDPARGETLFAYDAAGNVVETADGLGAVSRFEYDAADRLVKVIDPEGGEFQFTYDANGNQVAVRDAKGRTTTMVYDSLDRLVERVSPQGHSTRYEYDANDNLTRQFDPDGSIIVSSYDALSRRIQLDDVTFSYDAAGNVLEVKDPDSHLRFTYDALNRLTQAATQDLGHQPAATLTYTYNALGQRSRLADSEGGVISYDYDAQGRLTELLTSAGSFSLARDPAGRILERIYPNGVVTDYRYHPTGRLASLTHALPGASAPLADFEYSYDNLGNITSIAEGAQTRRFTYDSMRRLLTGGTASTPETYSYDAAGNRTGSSLSQLYLYDDDDRLLQDDDFTYDYDENGNLVGKTSKVDAATTNYSYDAFNRLEQITFSNGTSANYRYDGLGRRIEKSVNGVVTRYVYDGLDIILEFDGDGALSARYVHAGVDQPLSMERDGNSYYYHADHQQSVRLLTDSRGNAVNTYNYDSYGTLVDAEEAVDNPFTYIGREFDRESGLYYYRARYYDPQTGRFLSEDPLRLITAGTNTYQYVSANPINRVDSLGLVDNEWLANMLRAEAALLFAASITALEVGAAIVVAPALVGIGLGIGISELTFAPGQRAELRRMRRAGTLLKERLQEAKARGEQLRLKAERQRRQAAKCAGERGSAEKDKQWKELKKDIGLRYDARKLGDLLTEPDTPVAPPPEVESVIPELTGIVVIA